MSDTDRGADMASGGEAAAAISLPCPFVTTAPALKPCSRSSVARKAQTLYVNLLDMIQRNGIEKIGFTTLTFSDNCEDNDEAEARYHSLDTNFFGRYDIEKITCKERQERGALHYHSGIAFPWDIRTGFDIDAYRGWREAKKMADRKLEGRLVRQWQNSANPALKKWWKDLRVAAPDFGFGRCQTTPLIDSPEAAARYFCSYLVDDYKHRDARDKGRRTVRYSMRQRPANLKWNFLDGNSAFHRRGVEIFGRIFGLDFEGLKARFGKKFHWHQRKQIFCFGKNYDAAMSFVRQIPEWADLASRYDFCRRLLRHFTHNEQLTIQNS
jgi:hypothetical protein